ncbi:amino acid permease [Thioploca ingrica]|uniref:Amino acid permease n=1 Tax=Thioploca ingrica TaxID=40754 RepID=A0A090AQI7_9GAMM|nr:amino acid permease [Thioploca ingrica]
MSLFRTKAINADLSCDTGLKRCLSALDLTLLGIGAIIGAGIFVLTGKAAATQAGPAIVLSFVVSGIACTFSALAYAELAASVGGCGSAYGYAYAGFGELFAWIIGWDLILEYGVATPTVAIGWSGYFNNALTALGLGLPATLLHPPFGEEISGYINLPAASILLLLSILLAIGIRVSAHFNAIMVVVKLAAISIFITIALFHINPENWHPFVPFGVSGIMGGAALVFFAYIGFDAVSTAAEETTNPQRNLPIGILASLAICTVIYIVVSGLLTGIAPYQTLDTPSPVAEVLLRLGKNWAAGLIAAGAIAGLTTVMLVLYYGLTRVFLAMSRDGLLPPVFATVNKRTQTPIRIILVSGLLMATVAGFMPIRIVAELVNIGTMAAFVLVCGGVIILRYRHPNLHRPFKSPFSPLFPVLGIIACLALMLSLPLVTWLRFFIWLAIGMVIYFSYSREHSLLAQEQA